MSEYLTLDVMNNDSEVSGDATFGGIFGPHPPTSELPETTVGVPGHEALARMSVAEMMTFMESLLAARRHQELRETMSGERHADGSLRIPSIEAVWLISRIGKALGVVRLVNLRKVRSIHLLRSLNGVAGLTLAAIRGLEGMS